MSGPPHAQSDRDATIFGGSRVHAPAGWLALTSGGTLLIAFVAVTMTPLIMRPDPMLGLEIATAVPFVLVGVLSILVGVVGIRSERAATAVSIAVAVGLLMAGAVFIAATRDQQGFSAFRELGIAPWIVDLLPWLIAGAAVAHLAGAGAASAATRLQRR